MELNSHFHSSNPSFKKRSASRKSDSCELNQIKNNSDDHRADSNGNNNNNNSSSNKLSNSTHRSRRNLILDENLRINRTNHLSAINSNHYHYFHHHHHHHHHSIEVEENRNKLSLKAKDFDQDTDYHEDEDEEDSISNYSQALSFVSDKLNQKKTRIKARNSIFNNLYNQGIVLFIFSISNKFF
jgi:hypothetical protein